VQPNIRAKIDEVIAWASAIQYPDPPRRSRPALQAVPLRPETVRLSPVNRAEYSRENRFHGGRADAHAVDSGLSFVHFLTFSTDGLLRLLRLRQVEEPPVTEEEVAAMLDAGTAAGIFDVEEHDLVERVFWLGDQRVASLVTPRHRIEWLDLRDPPSVHREELIRHRYSHYRVCDGEVDRVLGMVRVKDLVADLLEGKPLDLGAALRKPLFEPDNL
jgi:hypothetical protein